MNNNTSFELRLRDLQNIGSSLWSKAYEVTIVQQFKEPINLESSQSFHGKYKVPFIFHEPILRTIQN